MGHTINELLAYWEFMVLEMMLMLVLCALFACISGEMPKSQITIELDSARATWISPDVALFSTKTGTLLLLSLIYDGR